MCGDPNGWMCDNCFAKMTSKDKAMEKEDFCPECQQVMERTCFCCMTETEEPLTKEGLCPSCAKECME